MRHKQTKKRSTRRSNKRKGGGPINYGDVSKWGKGNYYVNNTKPEIFTSSPDYYTQKVGGKKTRKNKMKGGFGFIDNSLRFFQPLSSTWDNFKFTSDVAMRGNSGSYINNHNDPNPMKQFIKS